MYKLHYMIIGTELIIIVIVIYPGLKFASMIKITVEDLNYEWLDYSYDPVNFSQKNIYLNLNVAILSESIVILF